MTGCDMPRRNLEVAPQRLKDLILNPDGHAFDTRTGRSFTLNPTGVAALSLLQDGHGPESLVRELVKRCGQHRAVVEAGVESFMGQLARYLA